MQTSNPELFNPVPIADPTQTTRGFATPLIVFVHHEASIVVNMCCATTPILGQSCPNGPLFNWQTVEADGKLSDT